MRNNSAGFSVTELIIVLAIIGVLAAVAIPSYNKYLVKSKVSEAMLVVDMTNRIMAEYYSATGTFPQPAYIAQQIGASSNGCNITLGSRNVQTISYCAPPDTTHQYYGICMQFPVGTPSAATCFYVIAQSSTTSGTNSAALTFKCGIWGPAYDATYSWHINDPSYLPATCNATQLGNYYATL